MTDPIGSEPLHHPLGRRRFMMALAGGLLAAPPAAEAQPAARVYRVGFLSPGPAPVITDRLMAALGERGWKVGHNLLVESRFTGGDPQRAETLARELALLARAGGG